ncbi:hypothetical protein Tco_1384309 [Tanacetum coccineum]
MLVCDLLLDIHAYIWQDLVKETWYGLRDGLGLGPSQRDMAWSRVVVSDKKGNEVNAVKASACWVRRPEQKVIDHVFRHNGASMTFKRFDYVDARGRSKFQLEANTGIQTPKKSKDQTLVSKQFDQGIQSLKMASKHSYDSLLARGNTLRSDEDSLELNELMFLCTNLLNRVLDLENTKTTQHDEILKSSDDKESLGEDASKQGRIDDIDKDAKITLVDENSGED